jgi:glyoxylase I family protein
MFTMSIGQKNKVIPGCGTHHISVQTSDWEESLRLYQDVLGMELVAQFGSTQKPMALLDMGDGSHIELVGPDPKGGRITASTPDHPILHFALATTDTLTSVEVVRQAGYEITLEPKVVDLNGLEVTIAFFKGPNGEEIEFFQTH